MKLWPPSTSRSLWCEPFGEGIPASLFRELSFVRTPSQTPDANCEGAKLSPILFPLLPHFKLHAGFPYRHVFLIVAETHLVGRPCWRPFITVQ